MFLPLLARLLAKQFSFNWVAQLSLFPIGGQMKVTPFYRKIIPQALTFAEQVHFGYRHGCRGKMCEIPQVHHINAQGTRI